MFWRPKTESVSSSSMHFIWVSYSLLSVNFLKKNRMGDIKCTECPCHGFKLFTCEWCPEFSSLAITSPIFININECECLAVVNAQTMLQTSRVLNVLRCSRAAISSPTFLNILRLWEKSCAIHFKSKQISIFVLSARISLFASKVIFHVEISTFTQISLSSQIALFIALSARIALPYIRLK